jgi:predicted house-cleaning noncanonical NTP pyrophosphatase (MazG superfamily)
MNKIVRDKIPGIMKSNRCTCKTRTLDDAEYLAFLDKKLDEEASEHKKDKSIEELAGIIEVVYAIAE